MCTNSWSQAGEAGLSAETYMDVWAGTGRAGAEGTSTLFELALLAMDSRGTSNDLRLFDTKSRSEPRG